MSFIQPRKPIHGRKAAINDIIAQSKKSTPDIESLEYHDIKGRDAAIEDVLGHSQNTGVVDIESLFQGCGTGECPQAAKYCKIKGGMMLKGDEGGEGEREAAGESIGGSETGGEGGGKV